MPVRLLLLVAVVLVGCSSSTDNGPPLATPADVLISADAATKGANAYIPNSLTISLASKQSVKWRNTDTVDHTVTEDADAFNSAALGPGGTFTFNFTTPGVYGYHCSIHPSMVGTITVTP